MYLMNGQRWPQEDPITHRMICHACWNVKHTECGHVYDTNKQILCDHVVGDVPKRVKVCKSCKFECDCVHLSESIFAQQEKQNKWDAEAAKKKLLRDMRDDPANPLRANNPAFQPKFRGSCPP